MYVSTNNKQEAVMAQNIGGGVDFAVASLAQQAQDSRTLTIANSQFQSSVRNDQAVTNAEAGSTQRSGQILQSAGQARLVG